MLRNLENLDQDLLQDTDALIALALAEDIGCGDATCEALIPEDAELRASIRLREDGIACGLWVAEKVFTAVNSAVVCSFAVEDGQACESGQILMTIEGQARSILTGERTALNLLQHLCGISTFTRHCVSLLEGADTKLLDTRKTTPGIRRLEKYAVRCGGGHNHRMGLYDRIMVKDNHLALKAGVEGGTLDFKALVERAAVTHPGIDVEIEVDTVEQFKQALKAEPEWILLDNMSNEDMITCVGLNQGNVRLEASGRVTPERLKEISACGVDAISMGALTHSVPAVDLGLDYL